eukprot:scaffold24744_cov103-Isochrysis_galbana.AAC.1
MASGEPAVERKGSEKDEEEMKEEDLGPTLHEIRDSDSDMGAAITYLLLELEGVDAEPDILDEGQKGPWTILSTSECSGEAGYRVAITIRTRLAPRSPRVENRI